MIRLTSPAARQAAMRQISQAPEGYVCIVKEATRSLEQNARLWAMLTDVSNQVVWHGHTLTPEEWKCVMTAAMKKQKVVPGVDGGFVLIGARTSKMGVREMGELMELIEAFGAQQGVRFSAREAA